MGKTAMKQAEKQDLIASILPKNWQEQKGANFSEDDLIDAYFKGKDDGSSSRDKIIMRAFQENLVKATTTAEELIHEAEHLDVTLIKTLLKIEAIDIFKVLFIVSEDDYVSENIDALIMLSINKKNQVNQDTFTIEFSFTYQSESLNDDCIAADGYLSKYAGTGKA